MKKQAKKHKTSNTSGSDLEFEFEGGSLESTSAEMGLPMVDFSTATADYPLVLNDFSEMGTYTGILLMVPQGSEAYLVTLETNTNGASRQLQPQDSNRVPRHLDTDDQSLVCPPTDGVLLVNHVGMEHAVLVDLTVMETDVLVCQDDAPIAMYTHYLLTKIPPWRHPTYPLSQQNHPICRR